MSPCSRPPAAPSARWSWNSPATIHDLGLVSAQTRLTWCELAHRIDRVAGGLAALGVEPGDRVAALAPNSAEWIVPYLAACRAGAAFVALNTWYAAGDLGYVLRQSGSRVLLCAETLFGEDLVEGVRAVAAECPDLAHPVVIGTPHPGERSFADLGAATGLGRRR
ncbi:AMP-binding protein [Streptomyces sp. NPDC005708]|uniref:AMP-binding protein n=1 Tax=Streptomyces sp. NPDC005708 TaxID=3154564 RepID=UPI0033FF8F35